MDQQDQIAGGHRQYADTADWTAHGPYRTMVTESRSPPGSPLLMTQANQPAGHYPDPAMPSYSLILFAGAGGAEATVDMGAGRETFPMRPGLLAVAPPDLACDYLQHGPARFLLLGIPRQRVADLTEQATGRAVPDLGPCHRFARDPLVEQLCLRMWDEAGAGSPVAGLFHDAALTAIVAAFLSRAGRSPAPAPQRNPLDGERLRRVTDYITDHLDADLSLADLAAVARLSEFHFARLFKATTGQPPHQFVIARRVERAKELIRAGRLTLVQVAAEAGFASQSHLNRHFKRLVGCTPAEFRT